jgi:hypothetical protein
MMCVQKIGKIYSGFFYKKLSLNALNEIKHIRRMRGMKFAHKENTPNKNKREPTYTLPIRKNIEDVKVKLKNSSRAIVPLHWS